MGDCYYMDVSVMNVCDINTLDVNITPNGGSPVTVSSQDRATTSGHYTWYSVSNLDISSYITSSTTYTLTFYVTQDTISNTLGAAYMWIDNINLDVTPPSTITVSSTGNQNSYVNPSTNDFYIGGAFTLIRDSSSASVTSITIAQTGTVTSANLTDLRLYYKQETTCSTSIPGDATLFNSTGGTFSSGLSTVTGSMTVGTSKICIYPRLDVGTPIPTQSIDLQITNPSTQIIVNSGVVSPSTAIAIAGNTTIGEPPTNNAPTFSAFNNNGPVNPGTTITFTATASDTDSENVKLVVCKTAGVSGTACDGGAGDTWCSSSLVASNPSCGYAVPSVTPDTTYNTYPYVFDARDLGSSSSYQGTLATYTINNVAPSVSAVTLNGGAAINLTESTTKAVTLTATITDNNSCSGGEIATVYGYVYRSGITYTGCDTAGEANNNYCYPEITCTVVGGTCTDNTDGSADYTCTTNLQYYADPTDVSTLYPSENWLNTIKAIDNNSASGNTQVSAGVEINSLVAFSVTSSINYGSLNVGQSNDPLDRTTTITPTGNTGLDQELSGSAYMCSDYPACSGSKIAVGNQKYALVASTAYASGTVLTTTATSSLIHVPKPTSGSPTTKSTWWGLLIPSGTNATTYSGAITVTGIKSSTTYW